MEIQEHQIYKQIKQKNPHLSDLDIIRIQKKIINKLNDRRDKHSNINSNINSRFHDENNLRNIPLKTSNNQYIPRIEQPKFQRKINRNELEDTYQDFYQQRNEYNNHEYVNKLPSKSNIQNDYMGENYRESFFRENYNPSVKNNDSECDAPNIHDILGNLENQLELFNLSSNYTIDNLKDSYKRMVLQHHPDRGGDVQYFKLITQTFNNLSERLSQKQSDKQFIDLKSDFNTYSDNQQKSLNVNLNPDKFNLDTFNQIYNNNRLETSHDHGYGDWKNTNPSEENKKTIGNFELNNFNKTFNQQKNSNHQQQQVIQYSEPEASNKGTAMNYSDIADTKINDFSSDIDSNLKFTDYKQAHTNNNLINISNVKVREYKNVDDLEKERSNISYKMTPQQLELLNIQKRKEELDEEKRLQDVRRQDDKYEQHFNKMNKLLVSNFQN